ncbi:MAG: hypothetical protein ACRDF4_06060 [Rhabdochlamydiaceae bacterium]
MKAKQIYPSHYGYTPAMWRLNVQGQHKERVFKIGKFFVNNRHDFRPGDVLLIQVIKGDEPGRFVKRVKGLMIFESLSEDAEEESESIYGKRWRYAIIPSMVYRFKSEESFNLNDVIGRERARRYDGQAEAIRLIPEDEASLRERISSRLPT